MLPENFCYWLQGFFEISKAQALDATQIQEIKNHLALVFRKETPQINLLTTHGEHPVHFPPLVPEPLRYCSSGPDCSSYQINHSTGVPIPSGQSLQDVFKQMYG